jgi:hypothetical protein
MTNLRVFENHANRRLIEISAAGSSLSHALFIPVVPSNFPFRDKFNPSELIDVPFGSEVIRVAFIAVLNRRQAVAATYRLIGRLEETHSINILNHLLDVLAWP